MERSEFRQRMDQFKQARESNPQLSYWEWKNSLPDNLAHTPDWQYNNFGAYTGGLKPELNEDGYYHLGSRNPYTGEILKPKSHSTYNKAIQNDAAAGYFPYEKNGVTYTKTYSPTGDISGYANGTDGIQSNTSEIPVTYSNGKWNYGYNPGAGFLKPVVSIQDAADLTPVGNAITANDVYQSASQGDYITAGLIGAAALLPGAISKPLKKIVREIPSVNPKYFSDKINKILGREVRPNGLSRDVYTDAINQRNRVIEDLYTDQDYWDRARAINEQYGDDYTKVYKGVLDTYENKYTGLPEPKAKQFFGDAKAEMAARKDAMERFRMNKIPAGYTDFEYNISPHLDRIDRPTAQHELGHYVDFNLSQNANADYNNNLFSALRRDLSTDNNPLYPDKTDYFRQGTEQKSYMNTLRSYMQSIGLMDRPGQKVTTKTIKRAIKSLPSEMNAVRAAYLQFNSPGEYTKWFNKIPLLSIPGAAMYLDSKEDNSYSDGTDGIKYYGTYSPKQQAYVLPVYDDKGENNVVLPEVTVTPQNNTDLAGYMWKGDFIKEAASFTPIGDVEDIYNIGKDIYDKNYAQAVLGAGLFFLPDILAKPIRKSIRKVKNIYNSSNRLVKLQNDIYATKANVEDAYQQYVNNFDDIYDDAIRRETELLKQKYPETVKKSMSRIALEQFAKSYNEAKHWNEVNNYYVPAQYKDNELYNRLYKDDRSYLQFAKDNNLPFDQQSTIDKWIDKQRRAIRGVYSNKPDTTIDELEPMFTKIKDQNIGGDRLRTSGGLYVSNSMDIADRFSRSLDDTPGTAAYAILQLPDIDRTLPIEQQLSSLRRRILPYDIFNTHLNFDPESLMNQGYIGIQAKYATRSGQRLPAYETALLGKPGDEPVTILDVHTSADTKNMHGRWGAYASATDELYSPRYIGESYGDFIHDARTYYNMLPEYYRNEIRDVPNPIFQKRKDKITEELHKQRNAEYDKKTQRIQILDNRLQRLSNIKTFDKDNFKSIAIPTTIGAGLLGAITGYGIRENNERNNYIQLMQQQGISPDLLDDHMYKSYYLTKKRNPKKAQDILQKQIKTLKNKSN